MQFNRHSRLEGAHAFLSASKYHWVNYDFDKLSDTFRTAVAARRGTDLHEFASEAIRLGVRLPRSNKTLCSYVNDAIGFRMTPEQMVYYSDNCFGTVDTISFRNDTLRIHDLKTGVTPAKFKQLEVYAAIFCLEYGFKPFDITIILRLYQNDNVIEYRPEPADITVIMDKIVTFSKHIDKLREEDNL